MPYTEPIPLIIGPTAVGKTEISHQVALAIGGEIISADSRAIYKHLDIGTATPSREQRDEVPYHLVNELEPCERYSAMDFRKDSEGLVREIADRGNVPMFVGGSRLYVKALTEGIFEGPDADKELRKELRDRSSSDLHDELSEVDPPSAHKIHPNDKKRLVRALEVYKLTGRPISKLKGEAEPLPYHFLKISLISSREALYGRIDRRVEEMIKSGLVEEVKDLLQRGFNPEWPSWHTIGYEEMVDYLEGDKSLEAVQSEIKQNTRNLARYQLSWIRNEDEVHVIDLTEYNKDQAVSEILDLIPSPSG